jgi:hypothetical protein
MRAELTRYGVASGFRSKTASSRLAFIDGNGFAERPKLAFGLSSPFVVLGSAQQMAVGNGSASPLHAVDLGVDPERKTPPL